MMPSFQMVRPTATTGGGAGSWPSVSRQALPSGSRQSSPGGELAAGCPSNTAPPARDSGGSGASRSQTDGGRPPMPPAASQAATASTGSNSASEAGGSRRATRCQAATRLRQPSATARAVAAPCSRATVSTNRCTSPGTAGRLAAARSVSRCRSGGQPAPTACSSTAKGTSSSTVRLSRSVGWRGRPGRSPQERCAIGSRSWPCRTSCRPSDQLSPTWSPSRPAATGSSAHQPSRSPARTTTRSGTVTSGPKEGRPRRLAAGTDTPRRSQRRIVATSGRATRNVSAATRSLACRARCPPCQGRSRPLQTRLVSQSQVSPASTSVAAATGRYRPSLPRPPRMIARRTSVSQPPAVRRCGGASDPSVKAQFDVTTSMPTSRRSLRRPAGPGLRLTPQSPQACQAALPRPPARATGASIGQKRRLAGPFQRAFQLPARNDCRSLAGPGEGQAVGDLEGLPAAGRNRTDRAEVDP